MKGTRSPQTELRSTHSASICVYGKEVIPYAGKCSIFSIIFPPCPFFLYILKEQDMLLDDCHSFRFAVGVAVNAAKLHRNRIAILNCHQIRVFVNYHGICNQVFHKLCVILQHIGTCTLLLHFGYVPVLILLNGKHLPHFADMRVMNKERNLLYYFLRGILRRKA